MPVAVAASALVWHENCLSMDRDNVYDFWSHRRETGRNLEEPMSTTPANRRLLIVDDELDNLRALERELHRWAASISMDIDTCMTGEQAMELLNRNRYAVVLTDNRMPGMSGTELVRRIRARQPTAVSIMITGYTEKHEIESALSSGIFAFVVKPWNRENLRNEIERALMLHEKRLDHLARSRRMTEELRMAVEFQKKLLAVDLPAIEKGIVPAFVQKESDQLGLTGDYLDIVQLERGRYLVLLGDISGHGLQTTFVAAMLKAVLTPEYLQSYGNDSFSPADLLAWANERVIDFTEQLPELFVAFSACLVDGYNRTITFSSAGNPLPLLKRGNHIQPVEVFGVALGVNQGATYAETKITLDPGDSLYLFTESIHLPRNGVQQANREAVYETILQAQPTEEPSHTVARLQHRCSVEELDDGITMVRLTAV